jgi:hypothetical protein
MNIHSLTKKGSLLLLAGLFLQAHAAASVEDSGPNAKPSLGYLTVYSSTEETSWGDGTEYYVHTGYRLYDSTGKAIKWIANHDSNADEIPATVELPPGKYTIWAQSDSDGYVSVPVQVKSARTTTLHLENENPSALSK